MHHDEIARHHRRATYVLLIVIALGIAAGRIAVVTSREGDTAFLSANDRSRWATIASLVEHGTYAIDKQIAIRNPVYRNRKPWDSIDKVRHLGPDGRQHYYSSKPPLFPTMVAGVYQVVHSVTGMTLTKQPIYVARIVLGLVNVPLLAIFLIGTIFCIERSSGSHWARLTAASATCFATMMLPFTVSLNNHLVAAASIALAMSLYFVAADRRVTSSDDTEAPWWFSLSALSLWAGLGAAFAAANELPALSMTVFFGLLFALISRRTIIPFCLGLIVVAAGFFGTNWLAHQSFKPAYAHRGDGKPIATVEAREGESVLQNDALRLQVTEALKANQLIATDDVVKLEPSDEEGRWVAAIDEKRFSLRQVDRGFQLAYWDDWYEYPGSYWQDGRRRGVDQGEPSRLVYFMQMTIGHHGIFSLTPFWILMPAGLILGLRHGSRASRRLTIATAIATVVCIAFYVMRPEIDRNYGGVSVAFRWLLWFAPLWLLVSLPVLQRLAEVRVARGTVYVLIALSAFSMATSLSSPWQSPWLYRFWQFLGWLEA